MADHFMRVRLAGDGIGAWPLGRAAAREPGDRQVEAAPEKMDRTALADELAAKRFHHGHDRQQDL